jgi:hypothetical protein
MVRNSFMEHLLALTPLTVRLFEIMTSVDGPPKDPCAGIIQIRFNGCDLRLPTMGCQLIAPGGTTPLRIKFNSLT